MKPDLRKRLIAEFLGTGFLVATVVGSGIMAERLADGNLALALLANTLATGAALVALILTFGPISGAHFNPVVSLADAMEHGLPWPEVVPYILAQVFGGLGGTILAHTMFTLPALSLSQHARSGSAQFVSENGNIRSVSGDLGMLSISFQCHPIRGRQLHQRSVLVHVIDILCKSCRDDCEGAQ